MCERGSLGVATRVKQGGSEFFWVEMWGNQKQRKWIAERSSSVRLPWLRREAKWAARP